MCCCSDTVQHNFTGHCAVGAIQYSITSLASGTVGAIFYNINSVANGAVGTTLYNITELAIDVVGAIVK